MASIHIDEYGVAVSIPPVDDAKYWNYMDECAYYAAADQLVEKLKSEEWFAARMEKSVPHRGEVEAYYRDPHLFMTPPQIQYRLELGRVEVRHVVLEVAVLRPFDPVYVGTKRLVIELLDRLTKWRRYWAYAQVQRDIKNFRKHL